MKREIKIGIYAVVILLCSWAGVRFLSGVDVFGRNNTYYAYYDHVNGVQNAAPIMLRGVKIGKVTDIRVSPDNPDRVEVVLSVPRSYKLPADTEAKIVSTGLMGGKAIDIVLGESSELLAGGSTIASSHERDLVESLSGEFGEIKERLVLLIDNVDATLASLKTVLDGNEANIAATVANLKALTAELERSHIVENIDRFAATLGDNGERLDHIVSNVDTMVGTLAEGDAVKSLQESLASLNSLLAGINSGEGTLGKIMYDRQLYENLTQASDNLSLLLADLKANPKRYVHFSLFGSKEVGEMSSRAQKKVAKKMAGAQTAAE